MEQKTVTEIENFNIKELHFYNEVQVSSDYSVFLIAYNGEPGYAVVDTDTKEPLEFCDSIPESEVVITKLRNNSALAELKKEDTKRLIKKYYTPIGAHRHEVLYVDDFVNHIHYTTNFVVGRYLELRDSTPDLCVIFPTRAKLLEQLSEQL